MKYVIIGGDAAGMSAAMHIVRNEKDAEITTLEKGEIYSYGQCGLPYVIGEKIPSTDRLIAREVETFRNKYGINALINHTVTNVDSKKRIVSGVTTTSEKPFEYEYDRLLIATGVSPIKPNWEGIHLNGIHSLKTIPDTHQILKDSRNAKEVTIIGGGYIGLEAAENFAHLGKRVRIIERNPRIGKIFDPDMGEHIHVEAKKHYIDLILEEEVQAFQGDNHVKSVITNKGEYETDLVLISIGVKPNTDFLKDSGIQLNEKGIIKVNEYLQTNDQNVFAAGDCATHYHIIKKQDDHIPLGTTANKQGRIAGMNMIGLSRKFQGIVGTSVIKFMDLSLGKTGLSEAEAKQLNIPYNTIKIESTDVAGYYPDHTPLYLKLIYHKKTKQVLGGQVIGQKGVAKRIDVLAVALSNGLTVQDLEDLDLSYAPPFNSVWDPLQQAARRVN